MLMGAETPAPLFLCSVPALLGPCWHPRSSCVQGLQTGPWSQGRPSLLRPQSIGLASRPWGRDLGFLLEAAGLAVKGALGVLVFPLLSL